MKYYKYVVLVFIYCWLFSGVGLADQPAGSDGQIQYNDNGNLAGAELYYSNQTQKLDIFGSLQVFDDIEIGETGGAANFTITTAPHFGRLSVDSAPWIWGFAFIDLQPGMIRLVSEYVYGGRNLAVGLGDVPQATLDVYGYAKLKRYDEPPVPCTVSRRGIIVMNNNYDLCVCRRVYSDATYLPSSAYRLVRNPGKNCW